jgi:aryl-alcohol dehydrogenase-like predicted oxidoreductase
LSALDDLVRAGKIRYVGCSNFSGWHLMKSLAVAERYNLPRHVAHQAYYSLANREYESELMPLGLDQGVSAIVWSPLASGRLTGKIRRGLSPPEGSRRGLRPEDRSRSIGSFNVPPSRASSSARATKRNCRKISEPLAGP